MRDEALTTVDLFAGCGGLSLGLQRAGFNGLFAVEKHPDAFATLEANVGDHFNWPAWLPRQPWDIKRLLRCHGAELAKTRPSVDLLVGGPPCQGFSTAGERQYGDARNKLVTAYLRAVSLLRPRAVLIENVRGFAMRFKSMKAAAYSDMVIQQLRLLGYTDACGQLLDLSEFGVPQRRYRFIIAATRERLAPAFFDRLNANAPVWLKRRGLPRQSTAAMALSDLQSTHGTIDCPGFPRFRSGIAGPSQTAFQRWAREELAKGTPLDSHRYVNHRARATDVFRRMLADAPRDRCIMLGERAEFGLRKRSATVLNGSSVPPTVTSIPDDLIHYSEPRVLTVRECARLQTFPDWFRFHGPYTSGGKSRRTQLPRYTQVANAVPPLFAEQLGSAWKEVLTDA
jgi:DNA (cytosine-5)-methyltransferase 1